MLMCGLLLVLYVVLMLVVGVIAWGVGHLYYSATILIAVVNVVIMTKVRGRRAKLVTGAYASIACLVVCMVATLFPRPSEELIMKTTEWGAFLGGPLLFGALFSLFFHKEHYKDYLVQKGYLGQGQDNRLPPIKLSVYMVAFAMIPVMLLGVLPAIGIYLLAVLRDQTNTLPPVAEPCLYLGSGFLLISTGCALAEIGLRLYHGWPIWRPHKK
jgi:Na+/proline symporter